MGFLAGLHTAGAYPEKLEPLVPLLDWVGMDIKAPFEEYEMVTGISGSGVKACESANILIRSGVPCEFRATLHPMLRDDGGSRLMRMAHGLKNMGAKHFVIQNYRPSGEKAPSLSFPLQSAGGVIDSVSALFDSFFIRP
jgi:pyruvate formate lyase activating enzyme